MMRRTVPAIVCLSLFFAFGAFAAEEACTVKNPRIVEDMPAVRKQGSSEYCYSYAGVAVLEQHRCSIARARGAACRPEEPLSLLDVMVSGNAYDGRGGGLLSGGMTSQILEGVKQNGSVALEACAPFDPIMKSRTKSFGQACPTVPPYPMLDKTYWRNVLKHFFTCYQTDPKCPCKNGATSRSLEFARELKNLLDLKTSVEEISDAFTFRTEGRFMEKALVPRSCSDPASRVKLPPYQVKRHVVKTYNPPTRDALSADLSALFDRRDLKPIEVNLCGNGNPKSVRYDCSVHALVLSGRREVCCGARCRTEYRIHDSAKTFPAPKAGGNEQWVQQDEVLKRIESYVKLSRELGSNNAELFTWLEP